MKKLTLALGLALLLGSCANAPRPHVSNSCVFMGKPAVMTVEFQGQEVGLCCKKCKAKWDGMSDEARAAAVAKAKR